VRRGGAGQLFKITEASHSGVRRRRNIDSPYDTVKNPMQGGECVFKTLLSCFTILSSQSPDTMGNVELIK
jgi:hypothetical protein